MSKSGDSASSHSVRLAINKLTLLLLSNSMVSLKKWGNWWKWQNLAGEGGSRGSEHPLKNKVVFAYLVAKPKEAPSSLCYVRNLTELPTPLLVRCRREEREERVRSAQMRSRRLFSNNVWWTDVATETFLSLCQVRYRGIRCSEFRYMWNTLTCFVPIFIFVACVPGVFISL